MVYILLARVRDCISATTKLTLRVGFTYGKAVNFSLRSQISRNYAPAINFCIMPQIAVIFARLGFWSGLNFRRAIINLVPGIYLYISGLYLSCDVIYQHLTSLLFEFKAKISY